MDYRNRTGSTRKNIEAHMVHGSDPKKSLLNQFQQAHDVKNLFVMDASSFTSKSLPKSCVNDYGLLCSFL
jgi:choline dehydrogenase-like flavoprotein